MDLCKSLLLCLFLFITSGSSQELNPFGEGPYPTLFHEFMVQETQVIDHHLGVYAPNATGHFPIVYFSMGLFGIIPPLGYDHFVSRIASHGFVVVAPTPNYLHLNLTVEIHADWLDEVDLWCRENLTSKLTSEVNADEGLTIDFDSQFLMGHSSGSHVMCEYLTAGCRNVKGNILLSPVDGVDPFGIIRNFCTSRFSQVNFDTPSLILSAELDTVSGFNGTSLVPPCAPENIGSKRFYNALPSNVWWIDVNDYGHADILDPFFNDVIEVSHFCAFHPDVQDDYRFFVAGEIISFLRGIQEGNCEWFDFLESTDLMPFNVTLQTKTGSGGDACGNGYCIWSPEK